MGKRCAVLMPSIRPEKWGVIAANLKEVSPDALLYPLGDEFKSYAEAINEGWKRTREPYVFLGADDLVFGEGWLDEAIAKMTGDTRVVGTNDLHNPYVLEGNHATHSLVDRRYIVETGGVIDDKPGRIVYPYTHQYLDCEFIETAVFRGVFEPCLTSRVEHLHPDFEGRPADAVDAHTRRNWRADFDTFESRRHLWGGGSLHYVAP